MSEQDSDKKNPSANAAQTGGGKSGSAGKASAAGASGSGSGSSSGSSASRKGGGTAASAKKSGPSGAATSRGAGAKSADPYQSLPRVPGPDPLQAHGRLAVDGVYQMAPRVWPD